MIHYEKEYIEKGYSRICGIDEAGRGPLAGPVCVAGVVLDMTKPQIEGINDSKKLSKKQRTVLAEKIKESAVSYHIEFVDADKIDELNILQSTIFGVERVVNNLKPDFVLCDLLSKAKVKNYNIDMPILEIKSGDATCYSIACASILAKVARDELMCEYAKKYPEYGFDRHMGYGTKFHTEAIRANGICPIHRKSFLKKLLQKD